MRNRAREVDVGHTLAANFRLRHLDATFFANNTAMLEALVFATEALVILDRAKNLRAEKSVSLWL